MRRFAVALMFVVSAAAQGRYYQFSVDQDALSGPPDFSFLNRPIGPADRICVRDGHFYRVGPDLKPFTDDDERVVFYGMNLAFGANFPEEKDAQRIARRLRRIGVNLVRLHHMDSQPDTSAANAGSTLMAAPYPTLNGVAIQRLRSFLNALAAEGVYCNLNLHVGYTFNPTRDLVPALPNGVAIPSQSKPLHIFYPRMVELQTRYTRELISALALADDPVLAMVEINNESSLLQQWQWSQMDGIVAGEYRTALRGQWNEWLARKYADTDALRAAWNSASQDGPELLKGNWTLEVHSPAQATMTQDSGVATVRVSRGGASVIAKQVGFSMSTADTYTVSVEMRADLAAGQSRPVYFDIKQDVSPWRTQTGKTVQVTSQWQNFSAVLTPQFDMNGIGRLGLSVENVDAPVYIRNATVHTAGRRGLAEGESLEERTVSLVADGEFASILRSRDYIGFLADTDKTYLDTMLAAVRESANPLVPVAGTQMGYGGLMNIDTHASLDYQDNHFYIDHYNFPNVAWDGRDWRIRDSSSLGSGLDTFLNIAATRQRGKPFTVSEYNQPWPNSYGAEIDPTLAAFGAFQDWDGIVHFAYSHGRNWDDGVPNGFNVNGDWTKFPNLGQSAWLFRTGAIRAGLEPIDIPVSAAARFQATETKRNGNIAAFLASSLGYAPGTALVHPVRLAPDASEDVLPDSAKSATAPYTTDTGELSYTPSARLFSVHADAAAGLFGFIGGGNSAGAGPLTAEPAKSGRGFVSLLVTPLDGRPIGDSEHLLLSNPGPTFRSQPGSSPPFPEGLVTYPGTTDWFTIQTEPAYATKPSGNLNGGSRPTWMERMESWITLKLAGNSYTVYPLDGSGQRLTALSSDSVQSTEQGLRIHLQADGDPWSPWYEIVRE